MPIFRKPMLLPNDEAAETIDWNKRLTCPEDYLLSIKDDGVRMEIYGDGSLLGRSLKPVPSVQVNEMAKQFSKKFKFDGVIEAELYAEGMTLPEIVHFSRAKDVTDPKYKKKWDLEWKKTAQGTSFYMKTVKGVPEKQYWQFPGRTPEWLCRWHDSLHLQVFGCFPYSNPMLTMEERYELVKPIQGVDGPWKLVVQNNVESTDTLISIFQKVEAVGREGLVIMNRHKAYKQGRITLQENIGYKFKNFNIEFDCTIIQVVEMTQAREGAPKTVNELGRSVTSKLQEDRIPTGMAKGFQVLLEDGQKMIVSLNGYTHPDRKLLWDSKHLFPGTVITCTGGKPVKVGGRPRSAHYTKGYIKKSLR